MDGGADPHCQRSWRRRTRSTRESHAGMNASLAQRGAGGSALRGAAAPLGSVNPPAKMMVAPAPGGVLIRWLFPMTPAAPRLLVRADHPKDP
jgi:hypothetical protein